MGSFYTLVMKITDSHIGFIGFGHMAQVMFKSIERAKLVPRSNVFFIQRDTHKMRENEKSFGLTSTSLKNLVEKSQVLILAVRPNQTELALKEFAKFDLKNKLLITVVSGVTIATYRKLLGSEIQIVRAMPNIASSVGEGMSVLSFDSETDGDFKSLSRLLFSCMGAVMELDEYLMDISCGIAGSGPGFVFRLIQAMAMAGEKGGIPYKDSLIMAAQVFKGASQLILNGGHPEDLLQQITVPGGTTEAGLHVMKETLMEKHLQMTVDAAAAKSRALGS
jgi:pyrroline-5-carboxylate reductase